MSHTCFTRDRPPVSFRLLNDPHSTYLMTGLISQPLLSNWLPKVDEKEEKVIKPADDQDGMHQCIICCDFKLPAFRA